MKREDSPTGITNYTLTIDEKLYNTLDNHIRILKQTQGSSKNKKQWMLAALEEKLAREKPVNYSNIPKEKKMGIKMDTSLHQQLDDRIAMIRRFRSSYNKKQWVLEAIQEKMEKEKPKAQKILEELSK